jgi:ABC-2 type transport system permease protein
VHALREYRLLVRWQALRLKGFIPLAIVIQAVFAFGIVVGYPLLMPEVDQLTILFLATGAPAVALVTMGLVALPQVVAQARTEGSLEYMRSLPVPRLAYLAADLTVWLLIVVPGVAFAVLMGAWAFGLDLDISLALVPATLLVAVTAAAIGYALASILPPMIAMLVTQLLVFGVLVFSPLLFPASRLPEWLQSIHDWLPIGAAGEVLRGSLASSTFPLTAGPFILLGAWCLVCLGIAYVSLQRRG